MRSSDRLSRPPCAHVFHGACAGRVWAERTEWLARRVTTTAGPPQRDEEDYGAWVQAALAAANAAAMTCPVIGCSGRAATTSIFVRLLTGASITLDTPLQATVATVKQQIYALEGVPPAQQRLIFGGKQLEDHLTLAHYRLQQGATLHIVARLRGD
jgi:hypothetical protein